MHLYCICMLFGQISPISDHFQSFFLSKRKYLSGDHISDTLTLVYTHTSEQHLTNLLGISAIFFSFQPESNVTLGQDFSIYPR